MPVQAIPDLKMATLINPANSSTYCALSKYYIGRHAINKALEICNQGLRDTSEPLILHVTKAQILIKMDKMDEAISNLNDAISISPNSFDIYFLRGECYLRLKQNDNAFLDFKKSMDLTSNSSQYFDPIIRAICLAKKYDEALEICDSQLMKQINTVQAQTQKGFIYYYKGDYRNALNETNKARIK